MMRTKEGGECGKGEADHLEGVDPLCKYDSACRRNCVMTPV